VGFFDSINDNLVDVAWETWAKIDAHDTKHAETESIHYTSMKQGQKYVM
jgi:hypothetical protein